MTACMTDDEILALARAIKAKRAKARAAAYKREWAVRPENRAARRVYQRAYYRARILADSMNITLDEARTIIREAG